MTRKASPWPISDGIGAEKSRAGRKIGLLHDPFERERERERERGGGNPGAVQWRLPPAPTIDRGRCSAPPLWPASVRPPSQASAAHRRDNLPLPPILHAYLLLPPSSASCSALFLFSVMSVYCCTCSARLLVLCIFSVMAAGSCLCSF